ncbi:MAG: glycoside hydrolase family 13 protein [Acidimicrobiaceae bacterium]|nr:glycoside hydrolase family 13 protein [Acidimicrobiaceae bacterium]
MAVTPDPQWWRQAVVYQVYPRSFADSDGNGIGDLRGITSRVPYLRDLGIDAVWLSPFYPSALADGGYDVDDYRNVDPRLGTLADFDELVGALHAAGIRILVDIVANHSSNAHEWFRAALAAAPGAPERNRYIFRDGRGARGELPPNDWPSHFGPSAWTRTTNPDGTPGQWYLHLFAPEQPDLNWDDPEVAADFITTLRFWADRGVDGFRIDAAHLLKKDLSEPYRPVPTIGIVADYPDDGSHPLADRDEVHEIYRSWRRVFDEYTPPRVAVAETAAGPVRRARYAGADELGQAFDFDLLDTPWDAVAFRDTISACLDGARISGSSPTWTLSNHDIVRHASRYALQADTDLNRWLLANGTDPLPDLAQGLRRARAAAMLLLALPGSTYLYQGEELGLPEVADLPAEVLQDPQWFRDAGARKGRDGCRVPIPWEPTGPSFGFGSGGAHLPMPAWFSDYSVERQVGVPTSTLELYRAALRLRRELHAGESLTWDDGTEGVVSFVRDTGWRSITNMGSGPIPLPAGRILLASGPVPGHEVPGETTVWLQRTT